MPDDLQEIIIPVRLNTGQLTRDMQQVQQLSGRFASTISRGFADAIVSGKRFSDVLRSLAAQLLRIGISSALKPAIGALGNVAGSLLGSLTGVPGFARGGVVGGVGGALLATPSGLALAGEAGPEAILPLTRGPDGRLGVRAQGQGAPVQVVMNISTSDAEGFRRNRGRIAAELARAVAEGQRNL